MLIELARGLRLPLLATNGISHATKEKRELQDVLTCVQHKKHNSRSRPLVEL